MRQNALFPLLLTLLFLIPTSLCTTSTSDLAVQSHGPSEGESEFQTAPELPSSHSSSSSFSPPHSQPITPIRPKAPDLGADWFHSRVIYPDEDPADSNLAWFRAKAGNDPSLRWRYIEHPLDHPTINFNADEYRRPAGSGNEAREEKAKVKPHFTFTAGARGKGKEGGQEVEVPVERVAANLAAVEEQGGGNGGERGLRSPQATVGDRRRPRRFNQVGFERIGSAARSHSSFRQKQAPAFNPQLDNFVAVGRDNSPTRHALDSARAKLEALAPHLDSSHPPSLPLSRAISSPADSLTALQGSTPASSADDRVSSWLHSTLPPSTPSLAPSATKKVAPYRLWSVPGSLPSINLHGYKKLSDRYPPAFDHWQQTLSSLRSLDFVNKWSSSLQWAHDHRIESIRPARVVTPLGAVVGSDVSTAPPRFLDDPENPRPVMESYELTPALKRLHAFRELAELVPPALVGHSIDVFDKRERAGWAEVGKAGKGEGEVGFHEKIHPIQYLSQMLRDRNGAVVLENAIHDKLHHDLTNTPPKVIAHLKALRNREKLSQTTSADAAGTSSGSHYPTGSGPNTQAAKAKGKETLEKLLGSDYALHNKFWYDHYRNEPPFKIRNPLHTPLEEFAAFADFADAVRLRKP